MIFLGYDDNSKSYRCYNSTTRKVVISRDVKFSIKNTNENEVPVEFSTHQRIKKSEDRNVIQEESSEDSINEGEQPPEENETEEETPQLQASRRANKGRFATHTVN